MHGIAQHTAVTGSNPGQTKIHIPLKKFEVLGICSPAGHFVVYFLGDRTDSYK
jgi:hypothetical protein